MSCKLKYFHPAVSLTCKNANSSGRVSQMEVPAGGVSDIPAPNISNPCSLPPTLPTTSILDTLCRPGPINRGTPCVQEISIALCNCAELSPKRGLAPHQPA